MRSRLYILICSMAALIMIVFPQVRSWPASVDIRVASSMDDAEEKLSNGSVDLGRSYLNMACPESEHIVGIRFQNVTIPRVVKITNAYIEFDTGKKVDEPTNLIFRGEAADNAHSFSPFMKDISKRPSTTASVHWNNIPPWEKINQKQQTPDLSSIVQEIINRPGWSAGNAMVLMITGSGNRSIMSFDGRDKAAPFLHIEYQSGSIDIRVCQSSDDAEEYPDGRIILYNRDLNLVFNDSEQAAAGIRFQDVDVPRGALITTAYLIFEASETVAERASVIIKGEANDDASAFNDSLENITNRTVTHSAVSWDHIPEWGTVSEKYKTPDLSPIVQEIVGGSGWSRKNAMVFIITGSGRRIVKSYDGKSSAGPVLHIEYTEGNFPYITVDKNTLRNIFCQGNDLRSDSFIISNTGYDTLRYVISDDKDWISCSPKRGRLAAGDFVTITLDYNTALLQTGTYEGTIKVTDPFAPNSPFDIDVRVTVQPLHKTSSCDHAPVYTKDSLSPAILILLDLSDSMQTLMPIRTDIPEKARTPDIKRIVQEIVERPGWEKGNAMAFMIAGSGHRTVESYDGKTGSAPLLHLEYICSGKPKETDIRVSQSSDDAEESHTGKMFLASTDLDLVSDMGAEHTIGIRFKNIPVPKNAKIKKAFIEFVPDESLGKPASLIIKGEALDNPPTFSTSARDISRRTLTNSYAYWDNIPEWTVPIKQSRIEIAKSVISSLVADKDIAWGYGTWCSCNSVGYTPNIDYTKIHVGCGANDRDHQKRILEGINKASANAYAGTPFAHSLIAAKKYFLGQKKDKEGTGNPFMDIPCQPKFLLTITDGLCIGDTGSIDTIIRQNVGDLCDIGVTPIAVGFGIDDATQLGIIARISNERGRSSEDLSVIHKEFNGIVQPFSALDKDGLMEILARISEKIKSQVFHGSSPVLTTSADHGDVLIVAEFDTTDWSGDLTAYTHDNKGMEWNSLLWTASESMPVIRKVFTIDPSDSGRVIPYTDSVLDNDNWICKGIGDIIGSTPVIIGNPPFYFPFDGYKSWKKGITRDPLVYVGANDGALHAFSLLDGTEQWAFFPESSHAKLNKANDPVYDQCSHDYYHQYYINGSPQVGDIYTGTSWMTILICGLREGGESYFALDVTHNKPFEDTIKTGYLWEFTDPELGHSCSDPSIERIKNGTGAEWGVFFGSGYDTADQINKEAYLYGIVAHNKAPLWNNGSKCINRIKISSTDLKDDALSSPLIADLDADYKGDRIYVGNLYGTMYRIKDIGKGEHPKISKLFQFGNTSHKNPIRAKAAYAYAVDEGGIWVYFGTGSYESQSDRMTGTQQYFLGLKEATGDPNYSLNKLVRLYVKKMEYMDTETHETQQVKVIEGGNDYKKSWALLLEGSSVLPASERVVEQPLVVAGKVFFSTFVPARNICSGNEDGDTWLYALEYETGLPPFKPVFDINKDGVCDDKDIIVDEHGKKHNIAAINVGIGPGSKPVFYKDKLFITTTDKNIVTMKVNLPENKAIVTSWRDCTI